MDSSTRFAGGGPRDFRFLWGPPERQSHEDEYSTSSHTHTQDTHQSDECMLAEQLMKTLVPGSHGSGKSGKAEGMAL